MCSTRSHALALDPDPSPNAPRQTGHLQTVLELLGRGAKVGVKAKNNLGATPLHLAAQLGATRVARELLAVGARPDAKDQV